MAWSALAGAVSRRARQRLARVPEAAWGVAGQVGVVALVAAKEEGVRTDRHGRAGTALECRQATSERLSQWQRRGLRM